MHRVVETTVGMTRGMVEEGTEVTEEEDMLLPLLDRHQVMEEVMAADMAADMADLLPGNIMKGIKVIMADRVINLSERKEAFV